MSEVVVNSSNQINGAVENLASDKSISHRVAIFSLLAGGVSRVENFLLAEDTLNSLNIAKALGATVEIEKSRVIITPPERIKEPLGVLDCGNAGTAMRLYAGLLSAQDGFFVLSGDRYLNSRTMRRISDPLRKIGAKIDGRSNADFAPLAIRGKGKLDSFDYASPIASAQVKSALILAALFANGRSKYTEPELTRNHTEIMLKGMGANITTINNEIYIDPLTSKLKPLNFKVPSDPSSGFFFAVAAAIVPNASVVLKNVLLNPTRIEAYKILQQMGAKVEFREVDNTFESIGDIAISYSELKGVDVSERISWLIDEIPALAIAMAMAKGKSVVKNAKELRVKESDRIGATVVNLKKCGIDVRELDDGFEIIGSSEFNSCEVDSYGDHRIAMSFAVAGIRSNGSITIQNGEAINVSFPNFISVLQGLGAAIEVKNGD